jgi:DNA-directed RNA polymerase subunit RPC12/RpoP
MAQTPRLTYDCPLCKAHMQLEYKDRVLLPRDLGSGSIDAKQVISGKLYECKNCGFMIIKSIFKG